MTDEDKTREQLLRELTELRQKVAQSEAAAVKHQRVADAWRDLWAQYEAMIEAFEGLIYICSQNYEVEFMNQRFIEHTGHYPLGQKCYQALHDRDSVCPWCTNELVFRGETLTWDFLGPKDNRWYHVVNTPIKHPDGTMSKMAMIQDITERRQAEEALRQSEEKYRTLVENVNIGVFRTVGGTDGRFIEANPALVNMLGYDSVAELMDRHVTDLYHDPEERRLFIAEISTAGFVKNKKLRLRKKDGAPLWASVTAMAQYDAEGQIKWIDGVIEELTASEPGDRGP